MARANPTAHAPRPEFSAPPPPSPEARLLNPGSPSAHVHQARSRPRPASSVPSLVPYQLPSALDRSALPRMLRPLGSCPSFGAALFPLPRQPRSSLGLAGPAGDVPCACRRLTSLPANALRFAPWPRMVTGCGAAPPGTVTEPLPSVIVLSAGRKMAAAAAEASGPSCSSAAAAAGAGAAGVSEWLVLRDGCMRCDADGLHSLSYHPALNAILAVTSRGTIKVIDGTSGATLQASALSGERGTPGGGWAGCGRSPVVGMLVEEASQPPGSASEGQRGAGG